MLARRVGRQKGAMMAWRGKWPWAILLATTVTAMGPITGGAASAKTVHAESSRTCPKFTIRRSDGSGLTTVYRFARVRARHVGCERVRRILRDDLRGCGRALGPSANWGEAVDGWTVTLTSSADGYRGRAEFHATYSIHAVG